MSATQTTAGAAACDTCLRRTQLLALVAGRLEIARHERRRLREVLTLDDDNLLAAVAGADAGRLAAVLEATSPTRVLEDADRASLAVTCRHDGAYPARLLDDRSAPAVLFVRAAAGDSLVRLADLVGDAVGRPPVVSIVGTRRASPDGLEVARLLGRGLAAAGVTVASGMALGVDSAAHTGAIDGGGRTVAVLAGGADVAYPARKRALHERIAATGAVISEMPPGFRAFRWNFPARNRTIAALGDATIVVEAAERSGSLITAELALELGREVAAVPGPVLSWRSRGTNALLRDGATLIRDARDALDLALGVAGAQEALVRLAGPVAPPPDLPAPLRALLAAVEDGRDTTAALATDAPGASVVQAGLMELELRGLIQRLPGGRVRRTVGMP